MRAKVRLKALRIPNPCEIIRTRARSEAIGTPLQQMDPHERLGPNQSAKIEAECLTTAQSTAIDGHRATMYVGIPVTSKVSDFQRCFRLDPSWFRYFFIGNLGFNHSLPSAFLGDSYPNGSQVSTRFECFLRLI